MDKNFIGERISELRLKKNVSEYQMSLDLGKNKSYIQSLTSGRSLPTMLSSDTFWSPQTTHYNLQLFQEKSTIASQRHDHASFPAFYQLNAWLLIAANITSASITFLSI